MKNNHNPSTHINSLSKAVISQLGEVAESTKAQIVDEAGNAIGITSSALDVNDSSLTDGSQKSQLIDDSGNFLYPNGTPVLKSVEVTRPADTTAYTDKDAIGSVAVNVEQVDTITLTGTAPTRQLDTITLTGTDGTADITEAGGLIKEVTFATDLTTTAANFVTAFAADYLVEGIVITSSGDNLKFESEEYGVAFTSPVITNTNVDLDGSVVNTIANVVVGEAEISAAGGLTKTVTFDTAGGVDLTDTAAER